MKIDRFKADDQDTIEEKTKQNQEDVTLSTSRNAVNVDESEVDGKSPHQEILEQINCELLNQDIAEVKLDKLKKVEGDKNGVQKLPRAFKILKRFQVILQPLMKVLK